MMMTTSNEFEPLPTTSIKVRLSYWLLTHWSIVRRWTTIGLIVIDVLLLGWAAWKFMPILRDPHLIDRIGQEIAQLNPVLPLKPQPMVIGPVIALPNDRGTDLVATITNPNDNRLALNVRYAFVLSDNSITTEGITWLLPGQTRYVVMSTPAVAVAADLKIVSLKWQRPNAQYPVQPVDIKVSDTVWEPASEGLPPRVAFMAVNNEQIGFKKVLFNLVVMGGGGQPTAAGTAIMNDLEPQEIRAGTVSWYSNVIGGSQIVVEPLTDPFDPANLFIVSEPTS